MRVRLLLENCASQFQGDGDFPHADCVKPDRSMPAQPLFNVSIIDPESLREFAPISSPSKHLHQVTRQEEQKTDRPNEVVEETEHGGLSQVLNFAGGIGRQNKHFSGSIRLLPDQIP